MYSSLSIETYAGIWWKPLCTVRNREDRIEKKVIVRARSRLVSTINFRAEPNVLAILWRYLDERRNSVELIRRGRPSTQVRLREVSCIHVGQYTVAILLLIDHLTNCSVVELQVYSRFRFFSSSSMYCLTSLSLLFGTSLRRTFLPILFYHET